MNRRRRWLPAGLLAAGICAAACAAELPPTLAAAYRGADPELLAAVRARFPAATESGPAARELAALLDRRLPADLAEWPPVFHAFRASLEGLRGKHSLRPWEKYRHAKAGLARFHGLVEAHPDSIEIRMLRCAFASQLPDFFELRPQVEADLAVLTDQFARRADPLVTETYCRDSIQWLLEHAAPPPELRVRLAAARGDPGGK